MINAASDVANGTLAYNALRDNGLDPTRISEETRRALRMIGGNMRNIMESRSAAERNAMMNGRPQAENQAEEAGEQYSITTGPNGDHVTVDIDQEQFNGKTLSEKRSIVRKYINKEYGKKVLDPDNVKAYAKGDAGDEYAYPAKRLDKPLADAKMHAGTELENLLSVSVYENHVPGNAHHPEYPGGWDYYRTHFYVNKTMYERKVNIGIMKDGRRQFYDVTDIKEDPMFGTSGQSANAPATSDIGSTKKMLPDNASEVKQKITDEDMVFSLKEPVEQKRDLVVVHNLTAEKLEGALELGGMPMPSIAVTKKDIGHSTYGEVSLVFGKDTVDPKNKNNKVC